MTIIRTKRLGCYEPRRHAFGGYFLQVDDPDFTPEIDEADISTFHIDPSFPRIPAELWQRWARLCVDLAARQSKLEVSMRLLRADDDPSQYRIVIPVQSVSSGHVDANFDNSRDIETGEDIGLYPPSGWHGIGSCHSHHTMTISFSPGDNQSELSDPGLHLLIRSIDTKTNRYVLDASVTTAKRRFLLDWKDVVDARVVPDITYHPDVMKNITAHVDTVSNWGNQQLQWQLAYGGYMRYGSLSGPDQDYTSSTTATSHSPWNDPQWDDFYSSRHDSFVEDPDEEPFTQESPAATTQGQKFIYAAFDDLYEIVDHCLQTEDEAALSLIREELHAILDMCKHDAAIH